MQDDIAWRHLDAFTPSRYGNQRYLMVSFESSISHSGVYQVAAETDVCRLETLFATWLFDAEYGMVGND